MRRNIFWCSALLLLGMAPACRSSKKAGAAVESEAGAAGEPTELAEGGSAGEAQGGQPPEESEGGTRSTAGGASGETATGGAEDESTTAGAAGSASVSLPLGCPGTIGDYTRILDGTNGDDEFFASLHQGQALILGGDGDDWFAASPPGAPDCRLGGSGNDRFETGFQSAPSTSLGGPGDDTFVLRGSLDTDLAYIADFKAEGNDRIVLDSMVYGLYLVGEADSLAPEQLALVPDFFGGNSASGPEARILYNPETGGVWFDSDADGEIAQAVEIAVIQNAANYQFSISDWMLE